MNTNEKDNEREEQSNMKTGEITFSVVKDLSILSQNGKYTKEANILAYGWKDEARLDVRNWFTDEETGQRKMLKGVCLTWDETKALYEALTKAFQSSELERLMGDKEEAKEAV